MKTIILICICSFASLRNINAQTLISPPPFQLLEANTTDDGLELGEFPAEVLKIDDNRILYSNYYLHQFTESFPTDYSFYGDILNGEPFKLTMIDSSQNKLHEIRIGDSNNFTNEFWSIMYMGIENDTITLLCSGNTDSNDKNSELYQVRFDTTLNVIDEIWFSIPLDSVIYYYSATTIINKKGNYVFSGTKALEDVPNPNFNQVERFVCEFNTNGEILTLKNDIAVWSSIWYNITNIMQLENGYYIVHPFHILNEDFEEIAQYNEHSLDLSGKTVPIDSTRFIFGGTGKVSSEFSDLEQLNLVNIDGTIDTIFYNYYPTEFYQTRPGFKAIAMTDTNHIYFATHKDGDFHYLPTNIALHSIQIDGTINWSYYFGGDKAYTPIDIVPLPDGGCVLFVWSIFPNDGQPQFYSDIEYVRFDINGNVNGLSTALQEDNFKLKAALLYPNPASDMLYIEHGQQLTQLQIVLVDALGKQVLSQPVSDKSINVNHLPVGNYFYSLLEKGALVQSGKVVIAR